MGKIGIIIRREFNERVRKKSFIVTTILTPLLFIGIIAATVVIAGVRSGEKKVILVSDDSGIVAGHLTGNSTVEFVTTDHTVSQIREIKSEGGYDDIYGILSVGSDVMSSPRDVRLYTYSSSTLELEMAIARQIAAIIEAEKLKAYDIEGLPKILEQVKTSVSVQAYRITEAGGEKESSSGLSMAMAYIFGFLIYMFVFLYGAMVMQGVIEEKSSKVLEVMVCSVKPFELMMGKILGIAAVAITQFLIWVTVLFAAGSAAMWFVSPDAAAGAAAALGESGMSGMGGMDLDPALLAAANTFTDTSFLTSMIGGFLIYFIGGYLLYAAMFAAIGSAVDNTADTQQLQLPVTIPMILALIVMMSVMKDPGSPLAFWFSMIPFTSPVIMVARLPYGVPVWELVLSLVILYGSFVFMVWMAGKIYRVGIFMTGRKPTLKELLKWARYKY